MINITGGLTAGLGSDVILGIVFLAILLFAGLKGGVHGGALVVVLLPVTLYLSFNGYLPQPFAYISLFIAGVLVFYVVREVIGGGWR